MSGYCPSHDWDSHVAAEEEEMNWLEMILKSATGFRGLSDWVDEWKTVTLPDNEPPNQVEHFVILRIPQQQIEIDYEEHITQQYLEKMKGGEE